MHRRSEYFEKPQADFDFRVVKQRSKNNAENKLSRLVNDFSDYLGKAVAPAYAPAVALA
jgi:hypothetical protein